MAEGGAGTPLTVVQLVLIVIMVTFGSINTIAGKWVDRLKDNEGRTFHHPFVQAVVMFIGQSLCLVAYFITLLYRKYKQRKSATQELNQGDDYVRLVDNDAETRQPTLRLNPFVFLPPAVCDIISSSLMYIGLTLTHASTYQMLRGAVIVFTGLLSVAFLKKVLHGYKWLGMGFVTLGLIVVGVAEIVFGTDSKSDVNGVITGDLLVIMAQVIVSIQMVYEEKFLNKYDVPALLAVGLEGIFGMIILSVAIIPMYFIYVPSTFSHNPLNRLEDPLFAFKQMGENTTIIVALSGTILSMALFNFAGISVTKELSATTRKVLDSVRTPVIWIVCLSLGWQRFVGLQVLGFAFLLLGMFVYNDIAIGPWIRQSLLPTMASRGYSIGCCLSFYGIERRDSLPTITE
uniref:Solute carrier family 35 member F6 n=1 Tax=Plectus sambesii TaxID=2011161 RepID=A0A914V0V2_9BILA